MCVRARIQACCQCLSEAGLGEADYHDRCPSWERAPGETSGYGKQMDRHEGRGVVGQKRARRGMCCPWEEREGRVEGRTRARCLGREYGQTGGLASCLDGREAVVLVVHPWLAVHHLDLVGERLLKKKGAGDGPDQHTTDTNDGEDDRQGWSSRCRPGSKLGRFVRVPFWTERAEGS